MADQKTCFKRVDYDLSDLLHYVDLGDIGLPDIQRPFVWSNSKVRDLFDSMYKGFPVGYLLFWENAVVSGVRQIGEGTLSVEAESGEHILVLSFGARWEREMKDFVEIFFRYRREGCFK